MAYRVLVSDKLAPEGLEILAAQKGLAVDNRPGLPADQLLEVIADYDGLVIRSGTKVTAEVIEAATKLKVVGRAGIGVDNVDVPAASRRGIVVMNTPGGNNTTTAEHAISLLLASARHIPQAHASLTKGKWERSKFTGTEVFGKTLGVVGLGNIGRIVADRGVGLAMKVIAYDPFVTPEKAPLAAELVSLDELFARSDFVTVHVPLTNDTRGLIDREAIGKMKEGVRIINCARGGIVDEEALAEGIRAGKVAGAALDVFVTEPPPADHPLLQLPEVVVTPHLGASTGEAQVNVAVAIAEQVVAFLQRGAITAAINMPAVTPEQREVLAPYLDLGEKLGSLAAQLAAGEQGTRAGTPVKVGIEYQGDAVDLGTKTVTSAVLRGLLCPFLGDDLNYVSAPAVARERGIEVEETTSMKASDFRNRVSVKVEFAGGSKHDVAGAVFAGRFGRIVKIDDFFLEAEPEGTILMLHNRDVPGVVGKVGTLLGVNDVNIARLELGRKGEHAVSLFHVDGEVPEVVLEQLRNAEEVTSATVIRF
jgi:D-3-phosphoglycerate dehydrogenase